jgi:hypothetical protein
MFVLDSRLCIPLFYCHARSGLPQNEVTAQIRRQTVLIARIKIEGVASGHED